LRGRERQEEDETVTMARLLSIPQGKGVQTEVSSESLHKEQLDYPVTHLVQPVAHPTLPGRSSKDFLQITKPGRLWIQRQQTQEGQC